MFNNDQRPPFPQLKEIVSEYYSKNSIIRWLFRQRLVVALKFLEEIKPEILLDAGCGDGSFIKLINKSNLNTKEIWGIDTNPHIRELKKEIPNCSFSVQSLLKTNFRDHKFDAIVCLDVLEHIEDIKKALSELWRILKEKGYLITSEPTESFPYKFLRFLLKGTFSQESGPGAGTHYYNAKEIEKIIKKIGFTKITSKKIPFFYPFDLFHLNLYRK